MSFFKIFNLPGLEWNYSRRSNIYKIWKYSWITTKNIVICIYILRMKWLNISKINKMQYPLFFATVRIFLFTSNWYQLPATRRRRKTCRTALPKRLLLLEKRLFYLPLQSSMPMPVRVWRVARSFVWGISRSIYSKFRSIRCVVDRIESANFYYCFPTLFFIPAAKLIQSMHLW